MKELMEIAKALDSSQSQVVLAIAVMGTLLIALKRAFEFNESRRSSKISKIKEALDCETLDKQSKDVLQKLLEINLFDRATGIWCTSSMRVKILEFYNEAESLIGFNAFVFGSDYLKEINGEIKVKLSWYDIMFALYLFSVSIVSLALLVFLFLAAAFKINPSLAINSFNFWAMVVVLLMFSAFCGYMNFPIYSAMRIDWAKKMVQGDLSKVEKSLWFVWDHVLPLSLFRKKESL